MDDQIVNLLRDRLEAIDNNVQRVHEAMESHLERDEHYWRKIDEQQAQLGVIKFLGSGVSGSALLAWLYNHFGGKP